MSASKKNKELIVCLINELNGARKERSDIEKYVADEALVQHFIFFESLFPGNELFIDEITAEANRVILRVRMKAKQKAMGDRVLNTYPEIEYPMVFGFEMERGKVIHHWLVADQAKLFDQLKT